MARHGRMKTGHDEEAQSVVPILCADPESLRRQRLFQIRDQIFLVFDADR
jgi:hypothetical protein